MRERVLRRVLPRPPQFDLEDGERVVVEAKAARSKGSFIGGTGLGTLLVTNRRILWGVADFAIFQRWAILQRSVNVRLADVLEIDRGGRFDSILLGSGRRFRLRLRSGKKITFYWPGDEASLTSFATMMRSAGG